MKPKKIKINIKLPPDSPAAKLDRKFQALRAQRGAPDPAHYKKLALQKQAEIDALKEADAFAIAHAGSAVAGKVKAQKGSAESRAKSIAAGAASRSKNAALKDVIKEPTRDFKEDMDPNHPITKEYHAMKQHDIGTLRNMIKGQRRISDASEYRSKDHAISAYLRHKHGDKKVAAAMGLKEDVDLDEAAWGQDKMTNLRKAHDRHMNKALLANRAGNDAAVKMHQSKMGMIKTQMNKLKQNEAVDQIDEISTQLKTSYRQKSIADIRALRPHAEKGEYKDLAKNVMQKRQAGVNRSNEEVEIEEGTFKYHMDKAIAADTKGDAKKKAYHLDNARSAKFAMKTADYAKNRELLAKHKSMTEDVELDESINDHVSQLLADKDINAKVEGTKVHVHPDNAARTRSIVKKLGTGHTVHASLKEHTMCHWQVLDEGWDKNKRNPQRGVKVGDKVRSYDFPGMHDDHYVEGHVVRETPSSYHLRVNKVVRAGKEIPTPAHMSHVEAPKGKGLFSDAYAVHKIMAKQQNVSAVPQPVKGAQKTFNNVREEYPPPVYTDYYKGLKLHFARGNKGGKSSSSKGGPASDAGADAGGGNGGGNGGGGNGE